MLLLLLASSELQREEPLLLGCLNLADDVVVDPEDGDGHLGAPLVPHRRHAALHADHAGPPRIRAHDPRTCLYDPSPALAGAVFVGVGDERLGGEEAAGGEAGSGEGEVAEAREEASRGGRHLGRDGGGGTWGWAARRGWQGGLHGGEEGR